MSEVKRCAWCGEEVNHSAAVVCDSCWELERRIRDRPDLTLRMLAVTTQKPMCSCGALNHEGHREGCPIAPPNEKPFKWTRVQLADLKAFYEFQLEPMRKVARALGYALAVHGSMTRDLDLLATPWVQEHASPTDLAQQLMACASGGLRYDKASIEWELKPHNRISTMFPICWVEHDPSEVKKGLGHVDLSVVSNHRPSLLAGTLLSQGPRP